MRGEVRCGSRLCENSDVELARRSFVSITLNNKRTALAVTAERRKERKQFCAFAARARFHTAWTQNGPLTAWITAKAFTLRSKHPRVWTNAPDGSSLIGGAAAW